MPYKSSALNTIITEILKTLGSNYFILLENNEALYASCMNNDKINANVLVTNFICSIYKYVALDNK